MEDEEITKLKQEDKVRRLAREEFRRQFFEKIRVHVEDSDLPLHLITELADDVYTRVPGVAEAMDKAELKNDQYFYDLDPLTLELNDMIYEILRGYYTTNKEA